MTTITKERLLTIKQWRETYGPGSNVVLPAEEAEELARIALASLEAEPVVYMWDSERKDIDAPGYYRAEHLVFAESSVKQWGGRVVPLYTAPPATVVPDNASEPLAYAYKELTPEIMRNHLAVFERYGIAPNDSSTTIQALRIALDGIERSDAMLHGAKPVSQTYKLNELSGNSPVTPDGWISCSERMPENIPGSCKEYLVFDGLNNKVHHDYWVVPDGDSAPVASFWNHYGAHVTHWMPLPEPPQEAK
ncbi:DUF551 domain-containing protein [Escherichia coli]|nr:DUF551 domain-containing protein [Escherichia coli]